MGLLTERPINHVAVKEAVFPFKRLEVDPTLGPEMKSTGEVMGMDLDFGKAYAKAQAASDNLLPIKGKVFLSVKDEDKPKLISVAKRLFELGFYLTATRKTSEYLKERGLNAEIINKVKEGSPHIVDLLQKGEIQCVINTVGDRVSQIDSYSIRKTVLQYGVPYFTTLSAAKAAVDGIVSLQKEALEVKSVKEYYGDK